MDALNLVFVFWILKSSFSLPFLLFTYVYVKYSIVKNGFSLSFSWRNCDLSCSINPVLALY